MYAVRVYPKRGKWFWANCLFKLKREACNTAEHLSNDDSVEIAKAIKVYIDTDIYPPTPPVTYKDGKKVQ